MKFKIDVGIIGFGFVGQALYCSLDEETANVIYDKYKKIGSFNELINTDILFICLPTPTIKGKQDATEIKLTLEKLIQDRYKGTVVIKSTVLYDNIKNYLSDLDIVYNPEFLNQNTSNDDFKNQHIIILGGEAHLTKRVEFCCKRIFNFKETVKYAHCRLEEAINLKYMHNIYHAYKVLFWNYVYENTNNHRKIWDLYSKVTGATNEMHKVGLDGKLGFGGDCFKKDLIAYNRSNPNILTEFMINKNCKYRSDEMEKML